MDVQTENADPPPGELQRSGKIRKGFKLFGKRKPGNIFSIRSKGDANKSPPIGSKSPDGLSGTTTPDMEQEPDKEKAQEVSQGEMDQADEEPFGEDGVLAAAPARTSISSVSSARSLSFLSLLRGGRRGTGGRRAHTVSQPVARQRRGLKGLFGNVKFNSKDKEDKEEAPPSPLFMSSRANSVEIIKEDLPLTPTFQPRSLDSPKTESCEDSTVTSPSEATTPEGTAGSTTDDLRPPLVPGDTSLSSLLADISSLLTFDSITGGGDIMADVEAEWGKASSATSAAGSEVKPPYASLFSKPTVSSQLTSGSVSTAIVAKPCPVADPTTASGKSLTPRTTSSLTPSPISKPSTIITTLTKSSTPTTHSVKLCSDSTTACVSIENKSSLSTAATELTTTPFTSTSLSAPIMSSFLITNKSTQSSTSATTTVCPNTLPTVVKATPVSPTLTSTASKLASEIAAPPPATDSVSKLSPVATPPLASAKPLPVTHSPANHVVFTQPPPAKMDSASSLNLQTSTSYKPSLSSAAGEPKGPVTVSSTFSVTTKPSSPAAVITSRMTTLPTSTTTPDSVFLAKPAFTLSPMDLSRTPPLPVPDPCPSSTLSATTKAQPNPASVPTPTSTSVDKIPPITKPTPEPVYLDKTPHAPMQTPAPTTQAVAATAFPTPLALGQSPKAPPAPAEISCSVSKDQIPASVSKDPAQIPVSVTKDPKQIPVSGFRDPIPIPVCVSKDPTQIPVSGSKDPSHILVSGSKDPPQIPFSGCKEPTHIPISTSKDPPAHAPAPSPSPVTSPLSAPVVWSSEASTPAKMTGSGQASAGCQLISPGSTGTPRFKTEELQGDSQASLQGTTRERKTPQAKPSGLSKIPVVGGGRAAKLPVRDNQHVNDDTSRDPPTPVLEVDRPHLNSHDGGRSRDKIIDVEANVPTVKQTQQEYQQPPQPKVLTSLPRDSRIPVKHGAQAHTSHIPQASRTKIPVSKVPVRRVGNKPAAAGGSGQTRK